MNKKCWKDCLEQPKKEIDLVSNSFYHTQSFDQIRKRCVQLSTKNFSLSIHFHAEPQKSKVLMVPLSHRCLSSSGSLLCVRSLINTTDDATCFANITQKPLGFRNIPKTQTSYIIKTIIPITLWLTSKLVLIDQFCLEF